MGNRFTLKSKLIASFTLILVIFAGVALFNLNQVGRIKEQMAVQNEKINLKLQALELKVMVQDLKDIASGLMISRKSEYIAKFNEKRPLYNEMIKRIGDSAATDEQRSRRSQLITSSTEYLETFDRAVSVFQDKTLSSMDVQKNFESMYDQSQQQRDIIFSLVDGFYNDFSRDADSAVQASGKRMDDTAKVMLYLSGIVIAAGLLVAFLLARSFLGPVRRLQEAVARISEGDLRHKIDTRSRDELGRLSEGFDRMVDRVREMIDGTRQIAGSLYEHSSSFHQFSKVTAVSNAEVIRAIEEIAVGAEQQAGRAEQSGATIAELDEEIRSILLSAEAMEASSREAGGHVLNGADAVRGLSEAALHSERMIEHAAEAMRTLAESTGRIGSITGTIGEISKQTNILALNAAIESARAGIHGRGFAVIAEEVRKLSLKTVESSRTISAIVHSVQKETRELENGLSEARTGLYRQNGKVGETLTAFTSINHSMEEIDRQIGLVLGKIGDAKRKNSRLVEAFEVVAAVAEETAAGVQQVNSASLQQDAAIRTIAEQADDIRRLALQLTGQISRFQVGPAAQEQVEEAGKPANAAEAAADADAHPADDALTADAV